MASVLYNINGTLLGLKSYNKPRVVNLKGFLNEKLIKYEKYLQKKN